MPWKPKFTFVDLFAGIGGFHEALHRLGGRCVMVCERDKFARRSYESFHKGKMKPGFFVDHVDCSPGPWTFPDDIQKVTLSTDAKKSEKKWVEHIGERVRGCDVVCAGFPCQPFSQAGQKKGFDDTRGTLFHDVTRIVKAKRSKAFFLENVRGLIAHDFDPKHLRSKSLSKKAKTGKTLRTIHDKLFKRTYPGGIRYHAPLDVSDPRCIAPGVFLVKASEHGLPQNRPRVFIIGFRSKKMAQRFKLPKVVELPKGSLAKLLGVKSVHMKGSVSSPVREVGFTLRCGGKRSPIDDKRNWDQYHVLGKRAKRVKPMPITWKHGLKLQGFQGKKRLPAGVSSAQMMKQLGNSVAVPAIKAWGEQIAKAIAKS
jgi:DNA (cytosine-5)-methyltransferase 1